MAGVKPIKEIPILIIGSLTTIKMQIYNENTAHIHFHSKSLHTITKINDNIYMVDFDLIFGVVNAAFNNISAISW